ncbi:PEP-CTERM sorting domain-containing protein [Methylobacillus flagellatus]|uniref:PEP-CTERM sorting domain-containing protein n=1 Tax=Methylobacillus flagellatus TaxID=405 RepID=UPI002853F927|nr:PEP-CTERM sorting domain-containing protein [Methylobacillus flagellatus]MDR5171796.1 PEP-CTERM sorting domain-containing protein [Methylobacillus flagellatus]
MHSLHKSLKAALFAGLALVSSSAHALDIIFDYRFDRNGWFSTDSDAGLMRRDVLQQAASVFSGLADNLSAIQPGAGDSWSVRFQHPSWNSWIENVTVTDLLVPENSLLIFVGASSFNGSVLGAAGSGTVRAQGSQDFLDAVAVRGQEGALDEIAADFGPWGGSIWFNSHHDWYLGLDDDGLSAGQPDFLTTATHELAHLLGFGASPAWRALLQQGDGGWVFTGGHAVAVYGDAVPVDGAGAHWAYGVYGTIDGVPVANLMDPGTAPGNREYMSDLDYAALADIGWQVSAVPEPSTFWMLLLGLVGVFGRWHRKQPRAIVKK